MRTLVSKLIPALVSSVAVLSLAGCMSTDPYTGEQKTSNTAKGATGGAVMGAIIGAATSSKKDRKKGVLTGAAAGAAIGGGIGFYMDKQEAVLRDRLQGTGVQVRRDGNNIQLIMPSNITFDTNSYDVKSQFRPVLGSVAEVLAEFEKTRIRVAGHTDSTGSNDHNQRLSEQRAENVKYLLTQNNVAAGRINATGYGERYPVASNDTTAGRQQNRRVELELEPIQ